MALTCTSKSESCPNPPASKIEALQIPSTSVPPVPYYILSSSSVSLINIHPQHTPVTVTDIFSSAWLIHPHPSNSIYTSVDTYFFSVQGKRFSSWFCWGRWQPWLQPCLQKPRFWTPTKLPSSAFLFFLEFTATKPSNPPNKMGSPYPWRPLLIRPTIWNLSHLHPSRNRSFPGRWRGGTWRTWLLMLTLMLSSLGLALLDFPVPMSSARILLFGYV